jgi:hypothetical protein
MPGPAPFRGPSLRAAVFSNLDGLFAFHVSAEDAEFLAEELGGALNKQDLLELGHYQSYARLTDTRTGERLPAFSVRLDSPPVGDSAVAENLAAASAERYGREALDVELDLQAAAERIHGEKPRSRDENEYPGQAQPSADATGRTSSARSSSGGQVSRRVRAGGQRKSGRGQAPRGGGRTEPADSGGSDRGEASAA